jgi:hypothetical protein
MGISNTIPPSRLIQPGVVANTAARPTSPFTGQAIYQVDTNQYLIWNGTAWVIPNSPAQNPTGLELVATQTVGTTQSSVTVASCFSATYDNYKITYIGGQSSAACHLTIQLSGITTAYYGGIMHISAAPGGVTVAGVNNAASWTYAGMMRGSTAGGSLDFDLHGPFLSNCRTRVNAPYVRDDDQSFGTFTGVVENATSATGFVMATSTGTITGGTIRVYGYRNT